MGKPCYRCQTIPKSWQGNERECAFKDGVFSPDNWNCATVAGLRDMAQIVVNNSDQNAAMVALTGGVYMVISWYKNRGGTEGIWLFREGMIHPIHIEEAEMLLNNSSSEIEFVGLPNVGNIGGGA
jgi:hypothetical protein